MKMKKAFQTKMRQNKLNSTLKPKITHREPVKNSLVFFHSSYSWDPQII